jgi:hypothetical protein
MSAGSGVFTSKSTLYGAGIVAATAGAGALVAYLNESGNGEGFKGLAAMGGALTGSTAAGVGGLVVAALNKKHRKTALATAALGLGGVTALILGSMVTKALSSAPAAPQVTPGTPQAPSPGTGIVWVQIPLQTALSPNIVYRLSDAATASEMQSATLGSVQSSLGSAFQVDGVWTGTPPANWVPQDTGTGRVYVEFWVSSATTLPGGLTSAARLYRQQATV